MQNSLFQSKLYLLYYNYWCINAFTVGKSRTNSNYFILSWVACKFFPGVNKVLS